MACLDQDFPPARRLRARIAALLETPFDRRQRRLSERVRSLRALSDAELSARGIPREDILLHVFCRRA